MSIFLSYQWSEITDHRGGSDPYTGEGCLNLGKREFCGRWCFGGSGSEWLPTAGKRIKTEVPFSHGNPSVIHQAIGFLAEKGYSLREKTCMVIGNGEMGKVAAQALQEQVQM